MINYMIVFVTGHYRALLEKEQLPAPASAHPYTSAGIPTPPQYCSTRKSRQHKRTIPARKPAEGQAGSGKVDGNIEKGKKKGATNGNAGWDGGNGKSSELATKQHLQSRIAWQAALILHQADGVTLPDVIRGNLGLSQHIRLSKSATIASNDPAQTSVFGSGVCPGLVVHSLLNRLLSLPTVNNIGPDLGLANRHVSGTILVRKTEFRTTFIRPIEANRNQLIFWWFSAFSQSPTSFMSAASLSPVSKSNAGGDGFASFAGTPSTSSGKTALGGVFASGTDNMKEQKSESNPFSAFASKGPSHFGQSENETPSPFGSQSPSGGVLKSMFTTFKIPAFSSICTTRRANAGSDGGSLIYERGCDLSASYFYTRYHTTGDVMHLDIILEVSVHKPKWWINRMRKMPGMSQRCPNPKLAAPKLEPSKPLRAFDEEVENVDCTRPTPLP
ncbi:hypothetical protein F5877DRAFT_73223 [Lentinula edodes]|nr:hypothetical protein F5877DRAFT_73223 [Lentinula edodes]